MIVLYVILAVLVLLAAVVLLRTAAFRPKAETARPMKRSSLTVKPLSAICSG